MEIISLLSDRNFVARKLTEYAPHLGHFETLITFEEVEKNFPNASSSGRAKHRDQRKKYGLLRKRNVGVTHSD